MSHIDSFKHALLGSFIGIPVYLPLEDIHGDFECTTRQFLIGGGSGEHPALIVKDPLSAVAQFLREVVPDLKMDKGMKARWLAVCDEYPRRRSSDILEFSEWTIQTFHRFHERCSSPYAENSYRIWKDDKSLEEWLVLGFGEFVFFALPNLAWEIISRLEEPYKCFHHVLFNNILAIPPNFPVYANGGNAFRCRPQD